MPGVRSAIDCYLLLMERDEIKIAQVDDEAERLAGNEYRIAPVERIDEQQCPAADRKKPERDRNHAAARPFRCDPLHHKAHRKKALRDKSQSDPGIEFDDENIVEIAGKIVEQLRHRVTSVATGVCFLRRISHHTPARSITPIHSRSKKP